MIKIVGLGPGNIGALTLEVEEILKNSKKIFLRTRIHPTVKYIEEKQINFKSFDEYYENDGSFDEVYEKISKQIITESKKEDIVYAVPGHPLVSEKTVQLIIQKCNELELEYKIYSAVSFIDSIIEKLCIDPGDGLKIIDTFGISKYDFDGENNIIITQVYNKHIASSLKLAIADYYGDEKEIYFLRAVGIETFEEIKKIKTFEIDRQKNIDYLTSIFIPKDNDYIDFKKVLKNLEINEKEKRTLKEKIAKEIQYENIDEVLSANIFKILLENIVEEEKYGDYTLQDVLKKIMNN